MDGDLLLGRNNSMKQYLLGNSCVEKDLGALMDKQFVFIFCRSVPMVGMFSLYILGYIL